MEKHRFKQLVYKPQVMKKKSILDRKYYPVLLCDIIVQLLKRYKVKLL